MDRWAKEHARVWITRGGFYRPAASPDRYRATKLCMEVEARNEIRMDIRIEGDLQYRTAGYIQGNEYEIELNED